MRLYSVLWAVNGFIRSEFIFEEHLTGVKKFVDRYWEMIHKASGWRAFRTFLLVGGHYLL